MGQFFPLTFIFFNMIKTSNQVMSDHSKKTCLFSGHLVELLAAPEIGLRPDGDTNS